MKNIAVLGSTGSIGTQTLDIIEANPTLFRASFLLAGRNSRRLIEQARKFRPDAVGIASETEYPVVRDALSPLGIRVVQSLEDVCACIEEPHIHTVVTATSGCSCLHYTISAIRTGKDIALANKETLVMGGALVADLLKDSPSRIYPVDSEHSAVDQCLQGEDPATVSRLILTASGGPFRTFPPAQLEKVTAADALRHPNWDMGAKITIDSATMLNKAFEVIEARWLFGIPGEKIEVAVHPQSIVHSMVEYVDGAVKAQLGTPDMHLPIAYALGARTRLPLEGRLTLDRLAALTFEKPDPVRFPCLTLASEVLELGGNTGSVVSGAGEGAVERFLKGELRFTSIYPLIKRVQQRLPFMNSPKLEDLVASNTEAHALALSLPESLL